MGKAAEEVKTSIQDVGGLKIGLKIIDNKFIPDGIEGHPIRLMFLIEEILKENVKTLQSIKDNGDFEDFIKTYGLLLLNTHIKEIRDLLLNLEHILKFAETRVSKNT